MNDRNGVWVALLVIFLIVLFAGPFMFMGGWMMGPGMMGSGMMGWRGYGYGYGFNWLGALLQMILFLVFLGLIAFGIYYLIGRGKPTPSDRSLEILKERYAKGEISREEYDRMRQELSKED